MGNARWSDVDWKSHAKATANQTQREIFSQSGLHPDLDPSRIKFRESVDSPSNQNSTPIIIASDVTGSMGVLAETLIKRASGRS